MLTPNYNPNFKNKLQGRKFQLDSSIENVYFLNLNKVTLKLKHLGVH